MQFEIRYQIRSPFFLGALLMFTLIRFLSITGTFIHIDISNQVAINSAYAMLQIELALFILGMLPILAFCHYRDHVQATAGNSEGPAFSLYRAAPAIVLTIEVTSWNTATLTHRASE